MLAVVTERGLGAQAIGGGGGVHSCGGSFWGCLCLKEDAFKDVQDPVSASRGSVDGGQRDQDMHNQKLAPQAREWEVS